MNTPRPGEGTTPAGEWGDWLDPVSAWERLLSVWHPDPLSVEEVPLSAALGRVLAAEVIAPLDSPAFDRSAVDGYAVRTVETASSGVRLRLAGEVPMGRASSVEVGPGEAIWVATGSMLPAGATGVIMVERTVPHDGQIELTQPVVAGENIVRRGDDLRAGDTVLRTGQRLRPQDLGIAASMGFPTLAVRVAPRVAIIAGGDELVTPGTPLGPGQIYDSNAYALAAQVTQWGGEPLRLPRVPDDPEAVLQSLRQAVQQARIVMLSGGSSVGIKDLTAEAINAAGQPGVLLHGVAMRPARPTIIGLIDGVLVIGIPGNPVSAMIASEVFARPAIERLLETPAQPAGTMGRYRQQAELAERVASQRGRQDFVRVRLEARPEGLPLAYPVPGGSNALRSMVDAAGILSIPAEIVALEAGSIIEVGLF